MKQTKFVLKHFKYIEKNVITKIIVLQLVKEIEFIFNWKTFIVVFSPITTKLRISFNIYKRDILWAFKIILINTLTFMASIVWYNFSIINLDKNIFLSINIQPICRSYSSPFSSLWNDRERFYSNGNIWRDTTNFDCLKMNCLDYTFSLSLKPYSINHCLLNSITLLLVLIFSGIKL